MDDQVIKTQLNKGRAILDAKTRERSAAILIPLIATGEDSYELLYEVRAQRVAQPGEVCFPGGHIEQGEQPDAAAVRETMEELLVRREQVELIDELGVIDGPGGMPLWLFVGALRDYEGSFDPLEVASTFTVPLSWLLTHEPEVHETLLVPQMGDDMPWELIPGGRDYGWRPRPHRIPFYRGIEPVIWGATARITQRFVETLRAGGRRGQSS